MKRQLGARLDFWGKPPKKLRSEVSKAPGGCTSSLHSALPVIQGVTGWDVELLCQQGLRLWFR